MTTTRVLEFLRANDGAFEPREIVRRTDGDERRVEMSLTRLRHRGLVERDGREWSITDDDRRLEAYDGYARVTASFNDQFGEENREEWRAHAPDGPHPSIASDE